MRVSPCSRKRIGECQFACKDLEKEKRKRKGGASFPRSFMGRHLLKVILSKREEKVKKGGLEYFLDSTPSVLLCSSARFHHRFAKNNSAHAPFSLLKY